MKYPQYQYMDFRWWNPFHLLGAILAVLVHLVLLPVFLLVALPFRMFLDLQIGWNTIVSSEMLSWKELWGKIGKEKE